jgi:eukaryotic-like serine/threonine-protein kinase
LASRSELVIRLIVLEYALRLRYEAQPPNPESYLPLCQQQADQLIRLLELTENKLPVHRGAPDVADPFSHSDSTVKEVALSASIALDPLPHNLGCFLLLRLLGRGGMGYVHAAIDLRSTAQVAVKVMRRIDAWSIYRFIEEFRWLSQLSHPNLVKLYDAFCEGDIRYFSMELVEGKTVREWFRKFSVQHDSRWSELRRILGQLASAIEYLHEHQVLHCDIKCSNMMIAAGGRAVLLDLGLAVRAGQDNRLVGTLQYMAPEVISGGSASYASDWYSFGVMVYEVLTDSFPPIQIDLSQTGQPGGNYLLDLEQLRHNLRDCPNQLSELCIDLLRTDPTQRPTGSQIVARLQGPASKPRGFTGQVGCRGRTQELAAMDAATHLPADRQPTVVIVEGESGSGKSTLLNCWAKTQNTGERLLLSVRCYRQDHTPVRLLNALVQELTAAVPSLPEECWKPSLEKHAANIRLLFPQLQQLLPDVTPTRTSESATRFSGKALTPNLNSSATTPNDTALDVSSASFVQWLLDLSHCQTLIISIDDAQWADNESLRTLKRLLLHPSGFRGSLVLADESGQQRLRELFQFDDASQSAASPLPALTYIPLAPLSAEDCLLLIHDWATAAEVSLNSSVAKDIVKRACGNPFLLQEIFRTYVHHTESGDISGSDWLIADSQCSVRRRFSMLPQPAENILQFLAVAEHSMSFHQLQMVSRILPHELQRTLSLLASQGWIRSRGDELESDVEIAHENFRKAIEQSIPRDRLHRRHYRLARILSCETPPNWARVANHYWSAEYFREAASCYLEAARNAIATGGNAEAIEFLDRANHPQARRTPLEQQCVTRMKADCLARVGSSHAAAELYDELLELELQSPQPDESQATILRCLSGEQRIRAGQLDAGLARLELALRQLGITSWKSTGFSQFGLALRTFRLGLRQPARIAPASNASHSQLQPFTEIERSLNRLSPALTFLDNSLGPDVILRMTKLAEMRGDHFDRALALLRSGILLSFGGRRQRRQALLRLSLGRQHARLSRSDEALATAHFSMFIWHMQRGQHATAARYGQAALSLYQTCAVNTQWEQQFLQWALLGAYWYGHDLRELQYSVTSLRQSARDRSDPMSLFWMHVDAAHKADLVSDQAAQARTSLNIASEAIVNQSFQSPRFFLWLSRIHQALYEDDPQQALHILQQDWPQLASALITRTNHYRWLALSARICCNLVALRQRLPRPNSYLRDARRCVRRMQLLEEPVFVQYAEAYRLVIEASCEQSLAERLSPPLAWELAIEQFHSCGHHLIAHALRWHYAFHAPTEQRDELLKQARQPFQSAGCVAPEKLLNIILPLPAHAISGA